MNLADITPLILTYNEEDNIDRTLSKLTWASQILIIDSYSTDRTLEIIRQYLQAQVLQRQFDTHTNQWNYGLDQVKTEWVLSLDADYQVSRKLLDEIQNLSTNPITSGYFISFRYCIFGKPLRNTILPPRQALFRKSQATYIDDGHTQLLKVDGKSASLTEVIYHDDRKPLSRWLWAQDRYLKIEANKLNETPWSRLSWSDRIRTFKIIAPFLVLLYCLVLKGGLLDGWRGWHYAFQRMLAEILLSLRLIETDRSQQ
ncbi:MAG: glycosyltransferase family 2 protein [Prochlorothrix sp.]